MASPSPRFVVFMATYNGARFLKQQLESIQVQTLPSWELVVRDDGSVDDTPELIDEACRMDPRIRRMAGGSQNVGAAENFMTLLREYDGDGELFAFSDQDDVWEPQKLEVLATALDGAEAPTLVYSNGRVLRDGRETSEPIFVFRPTDLRSSLFLNGGLQGCLMGFNRQLLELIRVYRGPLVMHDHLALLVAGAFGKIVPIDRSLVLYRKHDANVTASYETRLVPKVRGFFRSDRPVIFEPHREATRGVVKAYAARLPSRARTLFEAYEEFCLGKSRWNRLRLVLTNGFSLGQSHALLALKCLLRPAVGPISQGSK